MLFSNRPLPLTSGWKSNGGMRFFPTRVILHGYMHSKSQSGLLHVSRVKAACGQLENYFIFQLTAVLPDVQLPSEWSAQMAVLLLHRLHILSLIRHRKAGAVLYCLLLFEKA